MAVVRSQFLLCETLTFWTCQLEFQKTMFLRSRGELPKELDARLFGTAAYAQHMLGLSRPNADISSLIGID